MNSDQLYFNHGQNIVIREVWLGKILRALPAIVVRDTPGIIALYAPLHTPVKYALTPSGDRVKPRHRMAGEWVLNDLSAEQYSSLRLVVPGSCYSVILFRNPDLSVYRWYIILEDPLARTGSGFEVRDHFLDVLVTGDLSSWEWKDEDEFAEAIELGIVSAAKAGYLRAEGKKAAEWICSGLSPFNEWHNWQPERHGRSRRFHPLDLV
jgi:hypothetical protein